MRVPAAVIMAGGRSSRMRATHGPAHKALVLVDRDLAARLGDAARRRYAANYPPQIMARKLEGTFESVARRRIRVGRPLPQKVPV